MGPSEQPSDTEPRLPDVQVHFDDPLLICRRCGGITHNTPLPFVAQTLPYLLCAGLTVWSAVNIRRRGFTDAAVIAVIAGGIVAAVTPFMPKVYCARCRSAALVPLSSPEGQRLESLGQSRWNPIFGRMQPKRAILIAVMVISLAAIAGLIGWHFLSEATEPAA